MFTEEAITNIMRQLKCSREEAIDVLEYDDDVNKNKSTEYDLTPEQKANVQEMMRKTEHKKANNIKRERKPNELKEAIVAELADFLAEEAQGQMYEDVNITNKNRMIFFRVNGKEFELQLIEKRIKK